MSFEPTKINTKTLYQVLHKALGTKRPHATTGTAAFSAWLQTRFPANTWHVDGAGNMHVDLRSDKTHRTLFVAHVDTVHKTVGKNHYKHGADNIIRADGDVLGADDGAGVALLMHLMAHGVPAYYLFTQGEERGGIGAKYVVKHYAETLIEFDRAIAFDRRGRDSIITYQGGERCCSDEFADILADDLNLRHNDFLYSPDPSGVYTDTAEFTLLIPECTNISVGYDHEHSTKESLDINHYDALARAVVTIDWDALPTARDPLVQDSLYKFNTTSAHGGDWGGSSGKKYYDTYDLYNKYDNLDLYGMTKHEMLDMAYSDPELLVALIRGELGLN